MTLCWWLLEDVKKEAVEIRDFSDIATLKRKEGIENGPSGNVWELILFGGLTFLQCCSRQIALIIDKKLPKKRKWTKTWKISLKYTKTEESTSWCLQIGNPLDHSQAAHIRNGKSRRDWKSLTDGFGLYPRANLVITSVPRWIARFAQPRKPVTPWKSR